MTDRHAGGRLGRLKRQLQRQPFERGEGLGLGAADKVGHEHLRRWRGWITGDDVGKGIDGGAVLVNSKVDVGAGAVACRAAKGDKIASAHDLAHLHLQHGVVAVGGDETVSVVNLYSVAESSIVEAGKDDCPRIGREDRRAERSGDIDR